MDHHPSAGSGAEVAAGTRPAAALSPAAVAWRSIRDSVSLYGWLLAAHVRAQLQYRTSFALQTFGQAAATFVDFIALVLLFQRFPTLAGWSLGEVALLYGMGGISFALSDMACGGFDNLGPAIQSGTFDRVLTRPLGAFL